MCVVCRVMCVVWCAVCDALCMVCGLWAALFVACCRVDGVVWCAVCSFNDMGTLRNDSGHVRDRERKFCQVPRCHHVHDAEQFLRSRARIYRAGPDFAENVAPKHDHDLQIAPAAWCSLAMDHVMLQGAEVPNVEGPGPLLEADAARSAFQSYLHLAGPKNSQAGVKQRRTTISVPAVLSLAYFTHLHRHVDEGIV